MTFGSGLENEMRETYPAVLDASEPVEGSEKCSPTKLRTKLRLAKETRAIEPQSDNINNTI